MSLQARLEALALRRAGKQDVVDALKAGAVPGVLSASEHFQRLPDESAAPSVADTIPGARLHEGPGGRVWVVESNFPVQAVCPATHQTWFPAGPYGALAHTPLTPHMFAKVEPDDLRPDEIAFLDTETTGLAGGTGTVAFLIGAGWYRMDGHGAVQSFVLKQWLIDDFCHEGEMLRLLVESLEPFRAFSTYNGRCFDVPLLRTRCIMNRMRPPLWARPNLDLLPFARRLWKGAFCSVSLRAVEANVMGLARMGDVDGAEIPDIWHDFARTGRTERLAAVIRHNAQDVASLGWLLARQLEIAAEPEAPGRVTRVSEACGLAKWFERRRLMDRAAAMLEKALHLTREPDEETRLLFDLARLHRRSGKRDEAAAIWRDLRRRPLSVSWPAHIELAKHQEHHERDLSAARATAHHLLRQLELEDELRLLLGRAPANGVPPRVVEGLRRRVARLDKRLARPTSPRPPA